MSHSLFVLRPKDRPTRGHSFKLLQERCVTDTRKRFFSHRVASVWNSLLASIIDFRNFSVFKASRRDVNLTIFWDIEYFSVY